MVFWDFMIYIIYKRDVLNARCNDSKDCHSHVQVSYLKVGCFTHTLFIARV